MSDVTAEIPTGAASYRSVAALRRACAWIYDDEHGIIDSEFSTLAVEAEKLLTAGARFALLNCDPDTILSIQLNGRRVRMPIDIVIASIESVWMRDGGLHLIDDDPALSTLRELLTSRSLLIDVGSGNGYRPLALAQGVGCRAITYDGSMRTIRRLREVASLSGIQNIEAIWATLGADSGAAPRSGANANATEDDDVPAKCVTTLDAAFAGMEQGKQDRVVIHIAVADQVAVIAGAQETLVSLSPLLVIPDLGTATDAARAELWRLGYRVEDRDGHVLCLRARTAAKNLVHRAP